MPVRRSKFHRRRTPYKKRTYRKPMGRPNRSRHNRKPGQVSTQKIRSIIVPDRTFVKLKWNDYDTPSLTVAGGTFGTVYRYIMNSLFTIGPFNSPGVTAARVPGFQAWSTFYNQYRVRGVKATMTFHNQSGNLPAYCGYIAFGSDEDPPVSGLGADVTVTSAEDWKNYRELCENKWGATKLLAIAPVTGCLTKMSRYFPMAAIEGNALQYNAEQEYAGTTYTSDETVANPAKYISLQPFCLSPQGDSPTEDAIPIYFQMHMKFYVEFFDRELQNS